MKPFQIIILVIFGFGAVFGLAVFATSHGFGGGSKNTVGAVTIWGTLPQDGMDAVLGEVKNADKNFGQVSYVEKDVATFNTDLANAISEGHGPDLILISQEQLLTETAKITPIPATTISARDFTNAYAPMAQLFASAAGTYGIPFVLDPLVLYYNTALLSSAGLATPPATWEAVAGLAQSFTLRTQANAITRSTIGMGSYGNVTDARALLSLLLLQAGSPISTTNDTGVSSALKGDDTAAESAVNFYTQFADPAKTVYSWNRSLGPSRSMFLTGDVAFYPGFASERPFLAASNPNLSFDVAPIPQPSTAKTNVTYGLLYAFAVPRASANPNGALAAAFELTTPQESTAAATALSMAPASRTALTAKPQDPYAAVFYPQALIATGWKTPAPASVDAIFSSMIEDIATGRSETPQAITNASQSLNAALH
jgi:multiple sugar transport system substrate-binding protein